MGCVITTKYKGGQLGIAYVHGDLAAGGSSVTIHGTKGTLTVILVFFLSHLSILP